jgi:ribose/xylose/arabinose/galactoside ABC-type transport system permease subunit
MASMKTQVSNIWRFIKKNISFTAFVALFLVFSFTTDGKFFRLDNLLTVLGQSMDVLICALGATFIIMLGSIDLSAGSMVSLNGVAAAMMYIKVSNSHGPEIALLAGVGAAIGVSLACYILMGIVHTRMKVPTFIVTLGMLSIARALVTMISGGKITMIPFESPFKRYFGLAPWLLVIGIVVFIIVWLVERYTLFGRYARLIGGDEVVAKLSGINVDKQKMLVFIFAGVLMALGGVILAARIGSGSPSTGVSYELTIISAVVLGGTSQRGGIGGVRGTLIGTLTLQILANGLVLWQMPGEIQLMIKGIILILAVYVSFERTHNMVVK